MATIRPDDLPAAASVNPAAAIIVDDGATVEKATPLQVVDAAIPLASQAEAEAGVNNVKRVTPLRVKQAIDALGVTAAELAASAGADLVGFLQAGTGAVAQTVDDKLKQFVSVKDFGAVGDGVADDTDAIQAAIDYCRTLPYVQAAGIGPTVPYFGKVGALLFPPGLYRVTATLWFGIADPAADTTGVVALVYGRGAVIVGQTDGEPVVDLTGAFGTWWDGVTVFGSPTDSPNVGILLARAGDLVGDNLSGGLHRFTSVRVDGDFTLACVYNYGSEINYWTSCYLFNASGKFAYVNTSNNARYQVTSPYAVVAQTAQSSYADFFTGCFLKLSSINALGEAVLLFESIDFGPSIYNCYIDTTGAVYSANILFRNGEGMTPDQAVAITEGARIIGNTFEYHASADILALYEDAKVVGLTFKENCAPVNSAGGRGHIALGVDATLQFLDAQKNVGDTIGNPLIITKASGARVLDENLLIRPINPTLLGTGWTFLEGELTRDGTYRDIDLAALYDVPVTAKFVQVRVMAQTSAAANANDFILRGNGDTDDALNFRVCPPVSNISVYAEGLVPLVNGVIEYNIPANFAIARIQFRNIIL